MPHKLAYKFPYKLPHKLLYPLLRNWAMLALLALLLLPIGLPATQPALSIPRQSPTMTLPTLPSTQVLKQVTLQAREERNPPLGRPSRQRPAQTDRPIGFAEVFIRLENPSEQDLQIRLQRIDILSQDGQRQPFTSEAKEIRLRPLENAEHLIRLTNLSGYSSPQPVRAVITYSLQGKTYRAETVAVAIDRT